MTQEKNNLKIKWMKSLMQKNPKERKNLRILRQK